MPIYKTKYNENHMILSKTEAFSPDFSILELVLPVQKRCAAGWEWKWTQRPWYGVVLLKDGRGEFLFDWGSIEVEKGEVVFLKKGDRYTFRPAQNSEVEFLIVAFNMEGTLNLPRVTHAQPKLPARYFETIAELYRTQTPFYEERAKAYLFLLLCDLAEIALIQEQNGLETAAGMLETHLSDSTMRMEELAALSGYSVSQFRKKFHALYGCSPMAYRQQKRIEYAKTLLKTHLYTLEEVAELCGFNGKAYFYRQFHQLTGKTPGEYTQEE